MKTHLKNLIERLSNYSEKLDKIALLADKKWMLIDDDGNYHSYIFERNGDLVMSLNGQVKMGNWKYYHAAGSIKIDRISDQILLNQAFFDEAVMILKYDGLPDKDLFILADAKVIPDLDVKTYLESRLKYLSNIKSYKLKNGKQLEISAKESGEITRGLEVKINGCIPNDSVVESDFAKFYLKDGKLLKQNYLYKNRLSNGTEIIIEKKSLNLSKGDLLYIDGQLAPSGKYKISFFEHFQVVDGVIVDFRSW